MSFFKDFFKGLFLPLNQAIDAFKSARDSKDLGGSINALGGIVEVAAVATEDVAKSLKTTGMTLDGPEKHAIVKTAVTEIATGGLNKAVDIPGLDERAEDVLFRTIIGGVLDILIHATVKSLNKKGWKI